MEKKYIWASRNPLGKKLTQGQDVPEAVERDPRFKKWIKEGKVVLKETCEKNSGSALEKLKAELEKKEVLLKQAYEKLKEEDRKKASQLEFFRRSKEFSVEAKKRIETLESNIFNLVSFVSETEADIRELSETITFDNSIKKAAAAKEAFFKKTESLTAVLLSQGKAVVEGFKKTSSELLNGVKKFEATSTDMEKTNG